MASQLSTQVIRNTPKQSDQPLIGHISIRRMIMKSGVHLRRIQWIAGLFLALLLLQGCVVGKPGSQPTGITIHINAFKIPIDTPDLMCGATLVVDAMVTGLLPSHWNTPTGTLPAGVDSTKVVDAGYAIYTPLRFSALHIHVDHRQQPTTEYALLGGQVGADRYISDASPQMNSGTAYLLVFFSGVPLQGQAHTEKLMVVDEAFPIDAQGIVTLHGEHDEGKGANIEHFPAVTMPLSQITQQLAACK
jgi:hypothetical protein